MAFSCLAPIKERRKQRRINDEINQQIAIEKEKRRSDCKILLMGFRLALFSELAIKYSEYLGTSGAGKSTFVKQMRIIYGDGYSEEERRQYIPLICRNVFTIMQLLIDAMEKLRISYGDESAAV